MTRRRARTGRVVVLAIALACLVALLVAPWASSAPDGLERVAVDHGIAAAEQPHRLDDAPLAGYEAPGFAAPRMRTGAAGVIGVLVCFVVAAGAGLVGSRLASRRRNAAGRAESGTPSVTRPGPA